MADQRIKDAVLKLAQAIDNLSLQIQKSPAETKVFEERVRALTQEARVLLEDSN